MTKKLPKALDCFELKEGMEISEIEETTMAKTKGFIHFKKLPSNKSEEDITDFVNKTATFEIFENNEEEDVNLREIYFRLCNRVPDGASSLIKNCNRKEVYKYFKKNGYLLLTSWFPPHQPYEKFEQVFLLAKDDFFVRVDAKGESIPIKFLYDIKNKAHKKEIQNITNFSEKEERGRVNILVKEYGELALTSFKPKRTKLDLDNYNEDFGEVLEKTTKFLDQDGSGIILFHGEPGTGKTSFIRCLTELTDRELVYTTRNIAEVFDSPDFLSFAIRELKGKVLVLEDIESVLQTDGVRSSATTNILGLSDGLLSDLLELKIIASFNTDLENIDEAIRRKGRMFLRYEFKKLTLDKTNNLLKKLGAEESREPLTLAECYNREANGGEVERKKVGF